MRPSNQFARGRRLPSWAAGVAVLLGMSLAVACGGTAATPIPSAQPTPAPTPDPHLREPVTADQIFIALQVAKLPVSPNNANLGQGNPAIVKQINADVSSWPLRITQFRSAADLRKHLSWKAGTPPGRDEPPYSIAAMNILIQYGPISGRAPALPDAARQAVAAQIIGALDPLLWPLEQHSVTAVPVRTPEATPTPSLAPSPSKAPSKKTPRPSKAP